MTPAAAAALHTTPHCVQYPIHDAISQKSRKTQDAKKIILCQWGSTGRDFSFLKMIFILHINGGAQKRKFNFIKKHFFQWGYENLIL